MKNPRLTKKDLGLLKGSVRKVFSRSELRQKVIQNAIVKGYSDPKRKAVKFWIKCQECGKMEAKSNVQVDHVIPLVPINSSFEEMTMDELIDRAWCEEENLKPLCKPCHAVKTREETRQRAAYKKMLKMQKR